jgi:hypothetical protein
MKSNQFISGIVTAIAAQRPAIVRHPTTARQVYQIAAGGSTSRNSSTAMYCARSSFSVTLNSLWSVLMQLGAEPDAIVSNVPPSDEVVTYEPRTSLKARNFITIFYNKYDTLAIGVGLMLILIYSR